MKERMDISNSTVRQTLIQRYLEGETSICEERLLAEFYANGDIPGEEVAIAHLLFCGLNGFEALLDASDKEYERLANSRNRRRQMIGWAFSFSSAAAILAAVVFYSSHSAPAIDALQIAEGIERITELENPSLMYVEACPDGNRATLTAHLNDGSTHTFLIQLDKNGDTTIKATRQQ